MNQSEAQQTTTSNQQDDLNKFQPLAPKKMRLVDPAASQTKPGPKLQALIDGVGTIQREDITTDVLWTVNANVETMTPEEVQELTMVDPEPASEEYDP